MDRLTCPACAGTGWRDLPDVAEMTFAPCPCCQPEFWPRGFPGERVRSGDRWIWIIEPSEPGAPARYVAHPALDRNPVTPKE